MFQNGFIADKGAMDCVKGYTKARTHLAILYHPPFGTMHVSVPLQPYYTQRRRVIAATGFDPSYLLV